MYLDINVTNGQNKQTLQIYIFFCIMHFFPNTGPKKCLKGNLEYKTILYNSTELSTGWTSREFQSQTTLFSRKIRSSI